MLHMAAKEGSRLWDGFAGEDGKCVFKRGSGSKPEPYSVEILNYELTFRMPMWVRAAILVQSRSA